MTNFTDPNDGTILRALIRIAAKHGYVLTRASDGEEIHKVKTASEALEIVNSVDESFLRFRHKDNPKEDTFTAYIILNNGIGSPLSDWGYTDENKARVDAIFDELNPIQERADDIRANRGYGYRRNPARRKKRIPVAALNDTRLEVWEERDRLHIELQFADTEKTIAEWWDDDARQMFEDGFFLPRDLHQSVYDYAVSVGLINPPGYED